MTYMLDTNICIYAIKRKPKSVIDMVERNLEKGLCISAITLAELEHGVAKSDFPERNSIALLQFITVFDILPFDDAAASEYGKLYAYLQKRGTPIGVMDALIAGHAKAENKVLVTNNTKEFLRVPDLSIENWAE